MTDTESTAAAEPDPASIETPVVEPNPTPPWGDDFDSQRAWDTIQTQRASEDALKARVVELETRATTAETELAAVKRTALLSASGIPEALHAFITATDADGIAKQIAELTPHLVIAPRAEPVIEPRHPRPGLTPGHGGDDADGINHTAIASALHSARA